MHQGTRVFRRSGGYVRITEETVLSLRFLKQALKLRDCDLETRLGLPMTSLSRIYNYKQTRVTQQIYNIFYPRLQVLMEQADRGRGVPAVQDTAKTQLNPISTPEAKDFVLGPSREQVAQRSYAHSAERRANHRAAMKHYWEKRRAREEGVKMMRKLSVLVPAEDVTPPTEKAVEVTRPGLFTRLFRALFP